MKRPLLVLTLSGAALGLTLGCLYPDRGERRERGPEQRRDNDHEDRHGRDNDREHGDRHEGLSRPGLSR